MYPCALGGPGVTRPSSGVVGRRQGVGVPWPQHQPARTSVAIAAWQPPTVDSEVSVPTGMGAQPLTLRTFELWQPH